MGEARSDDAGEMEVTVRIVEPEDEAADAAAGTAGRRPAEHDEFFAAEAFDLEPGGAPTRPIGRVGAFADDALQLEPMGLLMEAGGVAIDMSGIAEVLAPAGECLEHPLAAAERAAAQVPPVEVDKVECVIEKPPVFACRQSGLQIVEVRRSVLPEGDELAVEKGGLNAKGGEARGETGHARRPVMPVARNEADAALVDPDQKAVAIQLEL